MTTKLLQAVLLATFVLLGAQGLLAQTSEAPIAGNWNSTLVIGGQTLRLVLKVTSGPDGLKAAVDSLDQPGGTDLAVDSITFQNNVLHFEMKRLSIVYEGTMNKEGTEIVGTFTQGGAVSLIFRKSGVARSTATVKRGRVEMRACDNPNLTSEVLCGKYEVFEN